MTPSSGRPDKTFSEWISQKYVEWRGDKISRNGTLQQFAREIGVTQPTMSAWILGNRTPKSSANIMALSRYFGPEVLEFLEIELPEAFRLFRGIPEALTSEIMDMVCDIQVLGLNEQSLEVDDNVRALVTKHMSKFVG